MKRYDERMLGLLLDRYEKSLLSDGTNIRTIHISQKITKKDFPEYYNLSALETDVIHEQLQDLERNGYVTLSWKGKRVGHILEKCTLNPERISEAYALLDRTSKQQKNLTLQDILQGYRQKLPAFTAWAEDRLAAGASIRRYVSLENPSQAERILAFAAAALENHENQFLRAFSIQVFHDSKAAETEIGTAAAIIADFERPDLAGDLDKYEILEECGIYRNPSYVFLKGWGISLDGSRQQGIGVFQDDLEHLHLTEGEGPDAILTIENLTSYHQWKPDLHTIGDRELVIYLAGYANRVKRQLLTRLHEHYPKAQFYHFGDIDCGGFRIWRHLCESTGIEICPSFMDLKTFDRYITFGRELTRNDRRALQAMIEDPFYKRQEVLFERMLSDNCKIEQECVQQYV